MKHVNIVPKDSFKIPLAIPRVLNAPKVITPKEKDPQDAMLSLLVRIIGMTKFASVTPDTSVLVYMLIKQHVVQGHTHPTLDCSSVWTACPGCLSQTPQMLNVKTVWTVNSVQVRMKRVKKVMVPGVKIAKQGNTNLI